MQKSRNVTPPGTSAARTSGAGARIPDSHWRRVGARLVPSRALGATPRFFLSQRGQEAAQRTAVAHAGLFSFHSSAKSAGAASIALGGLPADTLFGDQLSESVGRFVFLDEPPYPTPTSVRSVTFLVPGTRQIFWTISAKFSGLHTILAWATSPRTTGAWATSPRTTGVRALESLYLSDRWLLIERQMES
jgi:hypothetical protein